MCFGTGVLAGVGLDSFSYSSVQFKVVTEMNIFQKHFISEACFIRLCWFLSCERTVLWRFLTELSQIQF